MVEGWLLGLLPLTLLGDSDLESAGDEAGLRSGEAAAATEVTGGDCDVTGASVEMGGVLIGVRGGGGTTGTLGISSPADCSRLFLHCAITSSFIMRASMPAGV